MSRQNRIEIANSELKELKKNPNSFKEIIVIPDATFTLVHIQQNHYSKIYQRQLVQKLSKLTPHEQKVLQNKYAELIANINEQQKKIIDFCLMNRHLIDCLYVEGLSYPADFERHKFNEQIYDAVEDVKYVFQLNNGNIPTPNPPYFSGASYFLYHKYQLPVKGVEHGNLLRFTHQLYGGEKMVEGSLISQITVAHEERENQMLEHMTRNLEFNKKYDRSIKFLLCGEAHDFANNIQAWNSNNSDQKYNLLTWTP